MPKIDAEKLTWKSGSRYPKELGEPCEGRHWRSLGDAVGVQIELEVLVGHCNCSHWGLSR